LLTAAMSERKVLSHYYPPDFDPAALVRQRGPKPTGPRVQTVRLMAPFSMQCTKCGEFIYRGRKFNARKETPLDERYLGIQIFRFYIRCTRCSAEITFKTDPKNQDYAVERGAKRNTDPWRRGIDDKGREETDEERLDRLEREGMEEDEREERNAMVELEAKTADAKREMAVADALDEIRSRNARIQLAEKEGRQVELVNPDDLERERQDQEDEDAARKAFAFARIQDHLEEPVDVDGDDDSMPKATKEPNAAAKSSLHSDKTEGSVSSIATDMPPPPKPTFTRQVKQKKDRAALLGIKKKAAIL
jgi:hypothetical protein